MILSQAPRLWSSWQLEVQVKWFHLTFLCLGLSDVFLVWSDRGYGFWGGRPQGSRCPSHASSQGQVLAMWFHVDFDLDCPVEVMCIRFLHWKATLSGSPFRCPLGGIHYKVTAHTWRMGVMVLLERCVYRSHLEFFCVWNMSILLYLEKCIGEGNLDWGINCTQYIREIDTQGPTV